MNITARSCESGTMFTLHPQLERDTLPITELTLCRVLLMNNRLFPWIILVPRIHGAREIIDLDTQQRYLLMDEIAHSSGVMQTLFAPEKLNVAALGNQVPQLHIHIIARYATDSAWPNPVWGKRGELYGDAVPVIQKISHALALPRAS